MSHFRLIYADPPWFYNDRKAVRKGNAAGAPRFGIGASGHYSAGCMSDSQLAELGPLLERVLAPDAYLFMWATSPRLDSALKLGESWGFEYVTQAFVWVKTTKTGLPFYGTGAYTGSNVEPVLLFRRGGRRYKCWHSNGGGAFKPGQVVMAPHPTDSNGKKIHSRKPAIVREHLDRWLPVVPRLELFATERSEGWVSLGHALSGLDIHEELASLAEMLETSILEAP